jgi:DNA-binding response OmpR family regulator
MNILVVEDEPRIARLIKRGLKEEGYAVDIAEDGMQAIDKFEINSYDLIVLDIMLPKKDGLSVCRDIRKQNANVPVLLLTARGDAKDKVMGLDSGADDYLAKPFSFDELFARIRALLRRSPRAVPITLRLGDLSMNTVTREVKRNNKVITLTAREYNLLDYFIRNKGIALSKAQILDHVWDYNYDGMSNIIETYVKYLRQKLQVAPDSTKLIHTVRGHGYVLKEVRDV